MHPKHIYISLKKTRTKTRSLNYLTCPWLRHDSYDETRRIVDKLRLYKQIYAENSQETNVLEIAIKITFLFVYNIIWYLLYQIYL